LQRYIQGLIDAGDVLLPDSKLPGEWNLIDVKAEFTAPWCCGSGGGSFRWDFELRVRSERFKRELSVLVESDGIQCVEAMCGGEWIRRVGQQASTVMRAAMLMPQALSG
jgi:hypothetical protein